MGLGASFSTWLSQEAHTGFRVARPDVHFTSTPTKHCQAPCAYLLFGLIMPKRLIGLLTIVAFQRGTLLSAAQSGLDHSALPSKSLSQILPVKWDFKMQTQVFSGRVPGKLRSGTVAIKQA